MSKKAAVIKTFVDYGQRFGGRTGYCPYKTQLVQDILKRRMRDGTDDPKVYGELEPEIDVAALKASLSNLGRARRKEPAGV